MEARNVPLAQGPIVTYWEGEVVDNVHHSFMTRKWGASAGTDLAHWGKFEGFGRDMAREAARHSGRCSGLAECPYVFMRWKERFFVDAPANCSLTIAGQLPGAFPGDSRGQASVCVSPARTACTARSAPAAQPRPAGLLLCSCHLSSAQRVLPGRGEMRS